MATSTMTSTTGQAGDRSIARPNAREPERHAEAPTARPVSAEERQRMIRETAYARYARRNFAEGHALEDWLAAEAEVDRLLEQSDEIERLARAAT